MHQEKRSEIQRIQIGKQDIKLSFFTDDMIIYVDYPKQLSKNPPETNYSKIAGYKVNIQKVIAFKLPAIKQVKFKIKITVHLCSHPSPSNETLRHKSGNTRIQYLCK